MDIYAYEMLTLCDKREIRCIVNNFAMFNLEHNPLHMCFGYLFRTRACFAFNWISFNWNWYLFQLFQLVCFEFSIDISYRYSIDILWNFNWHLFSIGISCRYLIDIFWSFNWYFLLKSLLASLWTPLTYYITCSPHIARNWISVFSLT